MNGRFRWTKLSHAETEQFREEYIITMAVDCLTSQPPRFISKHIIEYIS